MRLILDALTVEAAGARLIDELSLKADDGEVVGLVGPNGSGKSTALRCVYRAMRPAGGVVRLDDTDLWQLTARQAAQRVAALTQENQTELDFTVGEIVALGRFPHGEGGRNLDERENALIAEAMRRTDVTHLADRGVLSLSGGERQRVLIARALVQEPELLVLDEPTNHLDLRHQVGLLSFLRECGLTVLVVLHDLNLAAATCDRIGLLEGGRLLAAGAPAEVLTPRLVERVFGVRPEVVTHPRTGAPRLIYDLSTPLAPEPAHEPLSDEPKETQ